MLSDRKLPYPWKGFCLSEWTAILLLSENPGYDLFLPQGFLKVLISPLFSANLHEFSK
jgi:hypothetical protein